MVSEAFAGRGSTSDFAQIADRGCVIPSCRSWSAYLPDVLHDEAEEEEEKEKWLSEEGLNIEPAGAPPFDQSMALYEMGMSSKP